MELELNLKGNRCPKASIRRNDFVFHSNGVYKCVNKAMMSFVNVDSRETISLDVEEYWRLEVLQLVPIKWEVNEQEVKLLGRELGLGPQYTCNVVGFKEFEELNVVNREAARGVKVDYYV